MATLKAPSTFVEFLALLEVATDRDQLFWENTPDEKEFRAPISNGHIWFSRYPEVPPGVFSQDATPGKFTITLVDFSNRVLDRVYAFEPEDVIRAWRFFTKVRRKLQNLDNFYDGMITDLLQKANQPK